MDKTTEKLNKLSLPVAILIASIILGGFYYASQVSTQKPTEKELELKEEAQKEAQQALNSCIGKAERRHTDAWNSECKALGKLTSECIDISELDFDEYLEKYGLTVEEYNKQRGIVETGTGTSGLKGHIDYIVERRKECSCSLPSSTGEKINKDLEQGKAECFDRYPQK